MRSHIHHCWFIGSILGLLTNLALGFVTTDTGVSVTALRPRAPLPSASASSCRRIRSRIGCNTRLYGLKVTIRIVGRKGTEKWIEDGCEVYSTRLKPANIELNTEWHKSNEALVKGVQSDWSKNIKVVLLDPKGQKLTSESFTLDFYRLLEQGGSRLVYAIGGAEGLPDELRLNAKSKLISLSDMTFTHQFARLLLIEQIYRASEIRKGSGYHK